MRNKAFFLVPLFIASAAHADVQVQTPELADALDKKFSNSRVLAVSPECKSDENGPVQIGVVLQQNKALHAIVAVLQNDSWVISDMPKKVSYSRGTVADFLDEFTSADGMKKLDVRCAAPKTDAEINIRANGAFIAPESDHVTSRHVCFSASAVYNSWVCYRTRQGTTKPELSFIQLNAD